MGTEKGSRNSMPLFLQSPDGMQEAHDLAIDMHGILSEFQGSGLFVGKNISIKEFEGFKEPGKEEYMYTEVDSEKVKVFFRLMKMAEELGFMNLSEFQETGTQEAVDNLNLFIESMEAYPDVKVKEIRRSRMAMMLVLRDIETED